MVVKIDITFFPLHGPPGIKVDNLSIGGRVNPKGTVLLIGWVSWEWKGCQAFAK